MTSAVSFSREYASFWRLLAPTTDVFVRRLNAHLYEREFPPLASEADPIRRAFINEIAFSLLCQFGVTVWSSPSAVDVERAVVTVHLRNSVYAFGANVKSPNEVEITELLKLFDRLRRFFWRECKGLEIEFSPTFVGCGFIDTCAGDVYCGETLFEIKAGDRSFRSVDLRQLLVYAALNKSAQAKRIRRVGLFNPRTGVSFLGDLDYVCSEISGRPSAELLAEIVRIISSGDVSR